jgi:hypothetical protein
MLIHDDASNDSAAFRTLGAFRALALRQPSLRAVKHSRRYVLYRPPQTSGSI